MILGVTACIAGSRTRKWKKEQRRRLQSTEETENLVPSSTSHIQRPEDDVDDDFLDTEDEEDFKARKAEEELDRTLTTRQKFGKEFKKCWNGKGAEEAAREREREERRKIAKAVAREIERLERRRARKTGNIAGAGAGASACGAGGEDPLPRYEATISGDRK